MHKWSNEIFDCSSLHFALNYGVELEMLLKRPNPHYLLFMPSSPRLLAKLDLLYFYLCLIILHPMHIVPVHMLFCFFLSILLSPETGATL